MTRLASPRQRSDRVGVTRMQQPDVHALAGAYALDALPEQEARFFQAHLDVCAACQDEVAGLRATAARLGAAAAQPVPTHLRQQVMAEIAMTRQQPAPLVKARQREPRWRLRRVLGSVAAAIVIFAFGLAGLAGLDARLDQFEARFAQVVSVLAAGDAQRILLQGEQHPPARMILSPRQGQAVFVANQLPQPIQDQVYELWLISPQGPRPAGLFRPGEHGRIVEVLTAEPSDLKAGAVTVEPEGGSTQPTSDPLLYGQI